MPAPGRNVTLVVGQQAQGQPVRRLTSPWAQPEPQVGLGVQAARLVVDLDE